MLWRVLAIFLLLSGVSFANAAEVDQFTLPPGQPVLLTDSAKILADQVNIALQHAIQQANSRIMDAHPKSTPRWIEPLCNESRLYDALAAGLARSVVGQLETFAENSEQIARRKVPFENSVYRNFYWQASPTLVLSERVASVINIANVEMGTDKLGHFFTEGYSYFLVTEHLQNTIESALLFGEWSESVYFGAQTTGVFSFADLTANFHGLRFWNRILARKVDPLAGNTPSPYVVCKNQRWVQVQWFDWSDYVDYGWSEAANCAALRSDDLLQQIQQQKLHCKVDLLPDGKYGQWQSRLLNFTGHVLLPQHLQPEVILKKRAGLNDVALSEEMLASIGEMRLRLEAWRQARGAEYKQVK